MCIREPLTYIVALFALNCFARVATADSSSTVATPAKDGSVRIAAVGDLLFGRYTPKPDGHGKIYMPVTRERDPFAAVAKVLSAADLTFGNLETPVMREPEKFSIYKTFTFRADPEVLPILAGAGFDILSLANNHMTNLGAHGAPITRRAVQEAGVHPVGAGADVNEAFTPCVFEISGKRIVFLAMTLWNNDGHPITPTGAVAYVRHRDFLQRVPKMIRAVRAQTAADFLILSVHWGVEYEPHPDDKQREMAHRAIDAGADVLLGHHPHVLQDFELYRGRLIAYSLGNFLFDNPSISRRRSVILRFSLSQRQGQAKQVDDVSIVPILIQRPLVRPEIPSGTELRTLTKILRELAPMIPIVTPKEPFF